MKRVYYTWRDVENFTQEIIRQIHSDGWRPDYVVGITRGGLVPANLISQYLGVRMETLKVSLRDGGEPESNLWMAEDAFGYDNQPPIGADERNPALAKNILIVDDINDSGATLNWIRQDWPSGCLPGSDQWNYIWGTNVRVATLIDNESSESQLDVNYTGRTINKAADPQWIVFPWEEWWMK
jgi:hypoxanthine phosphoribosyltransferase